jgi:hypothetical protein
MKERYESMKCYKIVCGNSFCNDCSYREDCLKTYYASFSDDDKDSEIKRYAKDISRSFASVKNCDTVRDTVQDDDYDLSTKRGLAKWEKAINKAFDNFEKTATYSLEPISEKEFFDNLYKNYED